MTFKIKGSNIHDPACQVCRTMTHALSETLDRTSEARGTPYACLFLGKAAYFASCDV